MKRLYNYSNGLSCSYKNTAITDNNKFLTNNSVEYGKCVNNQKIYGYKLQEYINTKIIFPEDNSVDYNMINQHQEEIKRVDQQNQFNILNSNNT